MSLDLNTGETSTYIGKKFMFDKILTFDGQTSYITKTRYNNKANPYVFFWNNTTNFGAIISKDVAKTTFIRLFMAQKGGDYFEPVLLKSPDYQIWKIQGKR